MHLHQTNSPHGCSHQAFNQQSMRGSTGWLASPTTCLHRLTMLPLQETPYGVLKHPLGSGRLSIIGLLSELLRTADPKAEQAILDSGLLRILLKLVLDYPFNAILHHQVHAPCNGAFHSANADKLVICSSQQVQAIHPLHSRTLHCTCCTSM